MLPHTPQHIPPHLPPSTPIRHHLSTQHPQHRPHQQQQYYATPPRPTALPSSKRFKPTPPTLPPTAHVPGDPAMSLDEEEDTSRGDILDVFSPKEIATLRYMQHHEWMEEVLGSAYSISNITPADLGLGLRGELECVTKGLLDPPPPLGPGAPKPAAAGAEKKSQKEVLAEFAPRVEAKIEEMEREMREMESLHTKRLAAISRTGVFRAAEIELRGGLGGVASRQASVGTEGEESPPTPVTVGRDVAEIIAEVEAKTSRKIVPSRQVTKYVLPVEEVVKMGGVVAAEPAPLEEVEVADVNMGLGFTEGGEDEDEGNTAGGLLDEFHAAAEEGDGLGMEDTIMADFMVDELGSKGVSPGGGEGGEMFALPDGEGFNADT